MCDLGPQSLGQDLVLHAFSRVDVHGAGLCRLGEDMVDQPKMPLAQLRVLAALRSKYWCALCVECRRGDRRKLMHGYVKAGC